MTISDICKEFDMVGDYLNCRTLTIGNINNTYLVTYIREGELKHYIIQKINTKVFKNPEKLMDNITRVTDYVHDNIVKLNLSTRRFVFHVFKTIKTGKPYFKDCYGEYWRCYRCIPNAETFDSTEDLNLIKNVGMAFGRFQNCLDGFDATTLFEVIKNFHNTIKRYDAFEKAVKLDKANRVSSVGKEIEMARELKETAITIQKLLNTKQIPIRVTHNDTKCNNVSFDTNTKEALAVLDLDTVMPGAIAFDFGDGIRSIASTVVEDCPDIKKVKLDLNKYRAFTEGFVLQVKDKLTEKEKETLNFGVIAMTAELAVRFLTDYLNGDVYFKNNYPGHNLDRTRNQLALAQDMLTKKDKMDEILFRYLGR